MISSKSFEKKITYMICAAILFSLIITAFPNVFSFLSRESESSNYTDKIFGKNIVNINIDIDVDAWNNMIANKMKKEYVACNINVDGTDFYEVGIRPKGNASLTGTQNDRIGLRFDFDHYVKNQSCYGLTKMVINNLQADATYMKDYIAYDIMQYLGVDAPLHTFANITLNGEPFGVYLLAEVYDEDYIQRIFRDSSVRLYNVKNSGYGTFEDAEIDPETCKVIKYNGKVKASEMGMGMPPPPAGGVGGMSPMPPGGQSQDNRVPDDGRINDKVPNAAMAPPPPGGMSDGGGDLVYKDNFTTSYKSIFANAVFDETNAKDYAKVIRAIKCLNKENVTLEEINKYWNTDEILRYFAAHTFMVNNDSYYGGMQQNYYLAEQDGIISILPWDYNLSLSAGGPGGPPPGMGNGIPNNEAMPSIDSASSVINNPIDTPLLGADMADRPLLNVLLNFDECKDKYHEYLSILSDYVSNEFIKKLNGVNNDIAPYIENEKVSFYTYEQHNEAFDVLCRFLPLRAWSIHEQLNGNIPSTTAGQKENPESLISSDFSISAMGSMGPPGGPMGERSSMMPPPGANGQGGMMPPPPPGAQGPNGQGGMMPPPPPGMLGIMQEQDNTSYYIIILFSLLILSVAFFGAKLFRRNY